MSLVFRRLFFLLALALVLVLSAYGFSRLGYLEWPREYDPLVLPDLDAPSSFLTPLKLKRIDTNVENCRAAFARAGKARIVLDDIFQPLLGRAIVSGLNIHEGKGVLVGDLL